MITVRVTIVDDDRSLTKQTDLSEKQLAQLIDSADMHLLDIAEGQTHESEDKEYYDSLQEAKVKLMGIYPILT